MFQKALKIIGPGVAILVILYMTFFKAVMVVSYVRTEGCDALRDSSGTVLVSAQGHIRSIAGVGVPVPGKAPNLQGAELEKAANEPVLIKTLPCLNRSVCQVWERPGIIPTMVTMLVKGPSYDSLYFKPFSTGTQLDDVQNYFHQRGVDGVAISLDEAAPQCLSVSIVDVKYDHIPRWKWSL